MRFISRREALILCFFAILTLIYLREGIFSSDPNLIFSRHVATDIYGEFSFAWEKINLLREGFIPIGSYWVDRGVGYPAVQADTILSFPQDLVMLFYSVFGNIGMADRWLVFTCYFLALTTSCIYGKYLFKRWDAAVVMSVFFVFSMYLVNQLEHIALLTAFWILPLVLLYWDKLLKQGKKYLPHAVLSLFGVFLSDWNTLLYLGFFLFFLLFYRLIEARKLVLAKYFILAIVVFVAAAMPILIQDGAFQHFHVRGGEERLFYANPPVLFLIRNWETPFINEIAFMYIGLLAVYVTFYPPFYAFCLSKTKKLKIGGYKPYFFWLAIIAFFTVYGLHNYAPVNLFEAVGNVLPFSGFVRVTERAFMFTYLGIAVLAGYGCKSFMDHIPKKRVFSRNIVLFAMIGVIFLDLTVGFTPPTVQLAVKDNDAYQFIREQQGNFKIMELPSPNSFQALTYMYTGHDCVNKVIWVYGFYGLANQGPLLYLRWLHLYNSTPTGLLIEETRTLNIKYILVRTNPDFYYEYRNQMELKISYATTMETLSRMFQMQDLKLVYEDEDFKIFEIA